MRLIDLLPGFYSKSPEMVDIQNAISAELDNLVAAKDDCFLQLDINTATWGLALWEEAYAIKTDPALPNEVRRAQIKAKMGGAGTTRLEKIESVAKNYTDGNVVVEELAAEYRFKIKYIDTLDFLPDIKTLTNTIEEIKPAHLAYEILVALAAIIFTNRIGFDTERLSISASAEELSAAGGLFTWDDLDAKGWSFDSLGGQALTWEQLSAFTTETFVTSLCISAKAEELSASGGLFKWSDLDAKGWTFDDLGGQALTWRAMSMFCTEIFIAHDFKIAVGIRNVNSITVTITEA